jgi:hypothetical protein
LKGVREKKQIMYKITAGFSTGTLKARRAWREVFQEPNENNLSPRIFYPEKL